MRGTIANGDKIVALRKVAGLTQEMLAAESGCDVKTLRSAERSQSMDAVTLRRIAGRLGVGYRDIIADIPQDRREANIAAAENYIRAFNARDPDAVAECFREDGAVIVLADPRLPGTGEFRGQGRIREWATMCFKAYLAEQLSEDKYHIDAVGDYVFVRLVRPTLQCLITGKQTTVSVMSEFEISDGRIAVLRTFPESGAVERITLTS